MTSSSSLDAFLREVGAVVAASTDPKTILDGVSDQLRRLLAGPVFLGEAHVKPDKSSINASVLHLDPQRRFVVTAVAWAPQQGTPIHDHADWGVIGAASNRLILTGYRREDDGATAGFADVAEVSKVLISENSFAYVRPPEDLITKLENPFRDPAVSLHVFGDTEPWQNMFDPPAKMVTRLEPSPGTVGV